MDNQTNFKPYVPASKVTPEITVTSVIMGILLAVIFGAANAYLGLRVGMTVSASIPAAVIAMGVIRVIMRKNSISFGRPKVRWTSPVLWKLHLLHCLAVFWVYFLWFLCVML